MRSRKWVPGAVFAAIIAVLGVVVFDGTAGTILVAAGVLLLLVTVVYATGDEHYYRQHNGIRRAQSTNEPSGF
jgi:hypothetical protein